MQNEPKNHRNHMLCGQCSIISRKWGRPTVTPLDKNYSRNLQYAEKNAIKGSRERAIRWKLAVTKCHNIFLAWIFEQVENLVEEKNCKPTKPRKYPATWEKSYGEINSCKRKAKFELDLSSRNIWPSAEISKTKSILRTTEMRVLRAIRGVKLKGTAEPLERNLKYRTW